MYQGFDNSECLEEMEGTLKILLKTLPCIESYFKKISFSLMIFFQRGLVLMK